MKRKSKFVYNGLLLSAVGLAMRGTQLMFGAYVARTLGADGVGLNTLVMMVYSFALTLATAGISLTVTRHVASMMGEGRSDDVGQLVRGALLYATAFGILSTVLLLLLSRFIGECIIGDTVSVTALRILAFSLLPSALSAVIIGYFVAKRRVTLNSLAQVLCQLFRIAVTVLLLTRSGQNPISMLALGVTASELVALIVLLPAFLAEGRVLNGKHGTLLSDVSKMALPLGISAYLRSALLTLEHNLIPKSLIRHGENATDALSSYGYLHGMALPFILYPMTPLTSFSGLLVPEFAEEKGRANTGKMASIATRALNLTLSYAVCSAVLIFAFSTEFGYAVYASFDAGKYIAMLAPVIPIMYLDHVADAILKGIGEHVYSMWVNILDAILSIVLVLTLIPIMGISGYAVVIVVMEVFNFALSAVRLYARIKFRIDLFGALCLPALLMTLAAFVAKTVLGGAFETRPLLSIFLRILLAICLYIGTRVAFLLTRSAIISTKKPILFKKIHTKKLGN